MKPAKKKPRAVATQAQVIAVLRAARAMIADPDCWRPVGVGGGRQSVVWAIINASVEAEIDYTIPLLALAGPVGLESTGAMIEWGRRQNHADAVAVFDRAIDTFKPDREAA